MDDGCGFPPRLISVGGTNFYGQADSDYLDNGQDSYVEDDDKRTDYLDDGQDSYAEDDDERTDDDEQDGD